MPFESMLHVLHGNKVIFIVIVIVIVMTSLGHNGSTYFGLAMPYEVREWEHNT